MQGTRFPREKQRRLDISQARGVKVLVLRGGGENFNTLEKLRPRAEGKKKVVRGSEKQPGFRLVGT